MCSYIQKFTLLTAIPFGGRLKSAISPASFSRRSGVLSAHFTRWFRSSLDERIPSDDELREIFIFPYEAEFVEVIGAAEVDSVATIGIKGLATIELVTPTVENPVWSIAVWQDQRDRASAKFSLGELRALFSQ